MEIIYNGPNKIRKAINRLGAIALIAYAYCGSVYNSTKTGHYSSDIATERSQPTELEKRVIEKFSGRETTSLTNSLGKYTKDISQNGSK